MQKLAEIDKKLLPKDYFKKQLLLLLVKRPSTQYLASLYTIKSKKNEKKRLENCFNYSNEVPFLPSSGFHQRP